MHDEDNYRYIGKTIIDLNLDENKILALLIKNFNHLVKYDQLEQLIYTKYFTYNFNQIRIKIYRLNKKLENENIVIVSRRNLGYILKYRGK